MAASCSSVKSGLSMEIQYHVEDQGVLLAMFAAPVLAYSCKRLCSSSHRKETSESTFTQENQRQVCKKSTCRRVEQTTTNKTALIDQGV